VRSLPAGRKGGLSIETVSLHTVHPLVKVVTGVHSMVTTNRAILQSG
jgi:hypothetical protein